MQTLSELEMRLACLKQEFRYWLSGLCPVSKPEILVEIRKLAKKIEELEKKK